jgi:soluble lytic murein transglycosylase-like protein
MIGQQGGLGVSPAELLAAKNMASGKSDMNKEISLGGDLTRLMLAAMQLKKSQAELEKLKLTQGANPQTTVAQDVQKGIAQLQGQGQQPEEQAPRATPRTAPRPAPQQMAQMDSGIGGLPAGAIDNEGAFAGGGIVAFAAGDPVESKPPTYNLTDDQKAYLAETDKIVGLPPGTSYRQIEVESAFNPRAVSPAKAMGLAQIIPDTLPKTL